MKRVSFARAVALSALLLACWPAMGRAAIVAVSLDTARFARSIDHAADIDLVAAFEIQDSDGRLGGLSALRVEGPNLLAVSDRGLLWRADLHLDQRGHLIGVDNWRANPVPRIPGKPRTAIDIEGMTRLPDGDLAVSLEGVQGILRLDAQGSQARRFEPLPGILRRAPSNEGPESVTTWPDGRLLVIDEGLTLTPDHYAAGLLGGTEPEWLTYQGSPGFKPSDAAQSGGRLYVLSRRFSLLGGFAARLTVTPLAAIKDGQISGRQLMLLDQSPSAENYEGVAVTPGANDDAFIYLVSDNNFFSLQRTLLLQFRQSTLSK